MTVVIGRLGWVALAVESTPGAPAQPVDYIPFLECSMKEKIAILDDASARGIRDAHPENSQLGKQWGEGNLKVNLDAKLSGYLFKAALGNDSVASEGDGVYTHTLTCTNTNNVPTSLSVIVNRSGIDKLLFPYSIISSFSLAFSDGFAEVNASIMSRFPVTSVSGTLVTTSGFYYAFRHAQIQVSDTMANALNSGSTLKIREFNMEVNNNSEAQFVAGNRDVDAYIQKQLEVKGSFKVAFEDTTQKTNFYNLVKQAIVVTFLGNGIGNGMSEFVRLKLYKVRIDELNIEMPNNDYVSQTINFVAEYSSVDGSTLDIQLRNTKASY